MIALHQQHSATHPIFRTMGPQHIANLNNSETGREPASLAKLQVLHDTDDETASTSSKGSLSSKSSKSSKSSSSSKSSKKKKKQKSKSKDGKRDKSSEGKTKKKKKKTKSKTKDETDSVPPSPTQVFRKNARKVQTLLALKKRFGLDTEELVEREDRSDRKYRRRSMALTATLVENEEYLNVVHDWDMPLTRESPSTNKEVVNLKSCIKTGISQKKVHWPSVAEALCTVTSVVGYDESMISTCFYNASDFNGFRLDKFVEDHPDEYEWVTDDEEYEEVVEEEIVYEYIEEEIIEEVPLKPMMPRRTSF